MGQSGKDPLHDIVRCLAVFNVVLSDCFKDVHLAPFIAVIDGGKHLVQNPLDFQR
jgi:hypothetical protein